MRGRGEWTLWINEVMLCLGGLEERWGCREVEKLLASGDTVGRRIACFHVIAGSRKRGSA